MDPIQDISKQILKMKTAYLNEINEAGILAFKEIVKHFSPWLSDLALTVLQKIWHVVFIEELSFPLTLC